MYVKTRIIFPTHPRTSWKTRGKTEMRFSHRLSRTYEWIKCTYFRKAFYLRTSPYSYFSSRAFAGKGISRFGAFLRLTGVVDRWFRAPRVGRFLYIFFVFSFFFRKKSDLTQRRIRHLSSFRLCVCIFCRSDFLLTHFRYWK